MKSHKIKYAAALLCAASVNANATLTSVDNGLGVYDSGINAIWTSNANLLGTMEANAIASGDANASNLITAIIKASGGVIHDTSNYFDNGTYTLSAKDFTTTGSRQGRTDWWGQQAFVHYLNTIHYAGSNLWALPSTVDTASSYSNSPSPSSSQLAELFYSELGGRVDNAIPTNSLFSNQQSFAYWSGTEYSDRPYGAWLLGTNIGDQGYNAKDAKLYAWAVRPGPVNAVPEPGVVWMFGTGLIAWLGLKRRVHAG